MRRFVPGLLTLDSRIVPTPIGTGELIAAPGPMDVPGLLPISPGAALDKAAVDALIQQIDRDHYETMKELHATLTQIEAIKAETWYQEVLDAIDAAIRSFVESHTPMFPTVP